MVVATVNKTVLTPTANVMSNRLEVDMSQGSRFEVVLFSIEVFFMCTVQHLAMKHGADGGNRTHSLRFTKPLLYR